LSFREISKTQSDAQHFSLNHRFICSPVKKGYYTGSYTQICRRATEFVDKDEGGIGLPPSATKMEAPIPITIAVTYATYVCLHSQGLLAGYLGETICPKCSVDCACQQPPPALELTNSSVDRSLFIFEKDDEGIDTVVKDMARIVLVRCPICKGRFRLLPADILPYKLYSLPVIERSVSLYNRGDLSLRHVAWGLLDGERTPQYTTLHSWTQGLGAWWLGRPIGEAAFCIPATRIQAELEIRHPQMCSLHCQPVWINPDRYRSQGRRERLEACKQFEIVGTLIASENPWNFAELNCLIVSWGNSFGLGFKTGINCTAAEHIDPRNVLAWGQILPKEPLLCPIHGRSPPSGSK